MVTEVRVFHLALVGPECKPKEVEFDALPNTGHAIMPLTERAVKSLRPLRVRVTVPPLCRIIGFHQFEGQEIDLVE